MRNLLFAALILLVSAAWAADDGSRFGSFNSSPNASQDIEHYMAGTIFTYTGDSGKDADSADYLLNNNTASRDVKAALYRFQSGVGTVLVDSSAWRNLSASSDTTYESFVWQIGYTLLVDSQYALVIVADTADGTCLLMRHDSTGVDIRGGTFTFDTQWPSSLPGSSTSNYSYCSYVWYDPVAGAAETPRRRRIARVIEQ
jgi:hypothetical protein